MCVCGERDCTVPYGKCHCGCGEDAIVPRKTVTRLGHVKGRPRPWARGHWFVKPNNWEVDERGCWMWQGAVDEVTGYGKWGKGWAHRRSYEENIGPVPDGKELDHLCRNRTCINPEHLEPVSHTVNARRGDQTKLTLDQVREIKRLRRSGAPTKAVARMYEISTANVYHIMARRSWKEVA